MKTYRIVEVGMLKDLYELVDDIETVREVDSVLTFTTPDDQEPQWLE